MQRGKIMASHMRLADRFYCQFMYQGKRHCFPLGQIAESDNKVNQADYLLMRLRQGLLKLPPGMDIVTFLQFDGKPPEGATPPRDAVAIGESYRRQ